MSYNSLLNAIKNERGHFRIYFKSGVYEDLAGLWIVDGDSGLAWVSVNYKQVLSSCDAHYDTGKLDRLDKNTWEFTSDTEPSRIFTIHLEERNLQEDDVQGVRDYLLMWRSELVGNITP